MTGLSTTLADLLGAAGRSRVAQALEGRPGLLRWLNGEDFPAPRDWPALEQALELPPGAIAAAAARASWTVLAVITLEGIEVPEALEEELAWAQLGWPPAAQLLDHVIEQSTFPGPRLREACYGTFSFDTGGFALRASRLERGLSIDEVCALVDGGLDPDALRAWEIQLDEEFPPAAGRLREHLQRMASALEVAKPASAPPVDAPPAQPVIEPSPLTAEPAAVAVDPEPGPPTPPEDPIAPAPASRPRHWTPLLLIEALEGLSRLTGGQSPGNIVGGDNFQRWLSGEAIPQRSKLRYLCSQLDTLPGHVAAVLLELREIEVARRRFHKGLSPVSRSVLGGGGVPDDVLAGVIDACRLADSLDPAAAALRRLRHLRATWDGHLARAGDPDLLTPPTADLDTPVEPELHRVNPTVVPVSDAFALLLHGLDPDDLARRLEIEVRYVEELLAARRLPRFKDVPTLADLLRQPAAVVAEAYVMAAGWTFDHPAGLALTTYRISLGLSLEQFAEHLGLAAASTLTRWGAGAVPVRRSLRRIHEQHPSLFFELAQAYEVVEPPRPAPEGWPVGADRHRQHLPAWRAAELAGLPEAAWLRVESADGGNAELLPAHELFGAVVALGYTEEQTRDLISRAVKQTGVPTRLGLLLQYARLWRQKSVDEVGTAVGVHERVLRRWEKGVVICRDDTVLTRLEQLYDMRPGSLVAAAQADREQRDRRLAQPD